MKSSLIATVTAIIATASSVAGSPIESQVVERAATSDVEPRFIEEFIISAIIGAASGALKGVTGGEQPACTPDVGKESYWTRVLGKEEGKDDVAVGDMCWTAGGYQFTDTDIEAAKCLVNLHVEQNFSCIDLEGSSCDHFPGTAVGNMRLVNGLSTKANMQTDRESGDLANSAIDQLKKLNDKGFDINRQVSIRPRRPDGSLVDWTFQIRGTGMDDC